MSLIQVGLVDKTGELPPDEVQAAAAALNIQVTRDLTQFWNVQATVLYLANPHKIPASVWPVFLVKTLPPGEGGFHMDAHNQPYAKVIATPGSDAWTLDASHEVLEMLVDPNGNRLQTSTSIEIQNGKIVDGTSQFSYLVEACDPCEADNYAYSINGVAVSDFITPHFYDVSATPGTRYSFTGAIKYPREILPGGYISWVNPAINEMQQLLYVDPNAPPTIHNLGPASGASLRLQVDGKMRTTAKEDHHRPYPRTFDKQQVEQWAQKRKSLQDIASQRAKFFD
jgi:hypothetical protein